MTIGKPFFKILKRKFDFTTKETRALLYLCEKDPRRARGLFAEYNALPLYVALFGEQFCELQL